MGNIDITSDDLLALDVDLRLVSVIHDALAHDAWDAELAALLRVAYGAGYLDALSEPVKGQLCRDHGLEVPKRRPRGSLA